MEETNVIWTEKKIKNAVIIGKKKKNNELLKAGKECLKGYDDNWEVLDDWYIVPNLPIISKYLRKGGRKVAKKVN